MVTIEGICYSAYTKLTVLRNSIFIHFHMLRKRYFIAASTALHFSEKHIHD